MHIYYTLVVISYYKNFLIKAEKTSFFSEQETGYTKHKMHIYVIIN